MTNTLRSKKGVTLVELLAVIVILGIIAAIAVPAIGGLIDRQRENAADASHEVVMNQARTFALGEGLQSGQLFTLAVMIDGYVDENPYEEAALNIIFLVGNNGSVTMHAVVGGEGTTRNLFIGTIEVGDPVTIITQAAYDLLVLYDPAA